MIHLVSDPAGSHIPPGFSLHSSGPISTTNEEVLLLLRAGTTCCHDLPLHLLLLAWPSPDGALETYGYWAVLAFVGIESMGVPFPGETMLIAAGVYAGATGRLDIGLVLIAAATGAIVGDNIGYTVGRFGGSKLLTGHGHRVGLNRRRIKLIRYLFWRRGNMVVFGGRFISVLRTYAALFAGTAQMPWPSFLLWNALGGVVWALAYGLASFWLGRIIVALSRPIQIAFLVAGAIAIVTGLFLLRRHEHRLSDEAERALPG
jgi:membrane protein DedA with SNARE-associated domain